MAEADKIPKPNTDEIATIKNDFVMDYVGNVATNPDKVLRSESGGKGIELYEDLLRDSEVASALQKRKLAVIGREWEVLPASEKAADVKIADFVRKVFEGFGYDDFRQALMSGIVLGFKPAEIMWEYSEGDVWVKDIVGRASRRFVFDLQGMPRLLTLQNMVDGIEVPDRKFVIYRNVSDNGSKYGDALGRSLFWPWWFRKNGIKFWAIFADKFGAPTGVGKYPAGTPQDKQQKLLEAVNAIQQETGIVIPDNMLIELLEAERTGSVNTYESFCSYMDKQIVKVILGHSAAMESTAGKLGNEKQADQTRQDYLKADADALCGCQNNNLVRWLVDYNFPGIKAYPKVWIRTEPEKDLKSLADRDKVLIKDVGLPVTKKYLYEAYGIPEPGEGEELVAPPPPGAPGAQACPNCGSAGVPPAGSNAHICPNCGSDAAGKQKDGQQKCQDCGCSFAESAQTVTADQRAVDGLVGKVVPDASRALAGNEEKIFQAIQSAVSYEDAMTKLLELYPQMDMAALFDLVERSGLNARIFGGYAARKADK